MGLPAEPPARLTPGLVRSLIASTLRCLQLSLLGEQPFDWGAVVGRPEGSCGTAGAARLRFPLVAGRNLCAATPGGG